MNVMRESLNSQLQEFLKDKSIRSRFNEAKKDASIWAAATEEVAKNILARRPKWLNKLVAELVSPPVATDECASSPLQSQSESARQQEPASTSDSGSDSGSDSVRQPVTSGAVRPTPKGFHSDDESTVCSSEGPLQPPHLDSIPTGHRSMDSSAVSLPALSQTDGIVIGCRVCVDDGRLGEVRHWVADMGRWGVHLYDGTQLAYLPRQLTLCGSQPTNTAALMAVPPVRTSAESANGRQ